MENIEQANILLEDEIKYPAQLPIMPLRDICIFPNMVIPLVIARPQSIAIVNDVLSGNRLMGVLLQQDSDVETPTSQELYQIGSMASILKMLKFPDGSIRLLVQGISRIKVKQFIPSDKYMVADVEHMNPVNADTIKVEALVRNVLELLKKVITMSPSIPDELQVAALNIDEPGRLADLIAANLNLDLAVQQSLLETIDVEKRLSRVHELLNEELEVLKIGSSIQDQVRTKIDQSQREFYLREQLKAIQKELGESDDRTEEIEELRAKIREANMPQKAEKEALKELDRFSRMSPAAAEYTVSRTYLDWLIELPWQKSSEDNLDINQAKKILDEDHFDLGKVKDRILEFLAVRKMRASHKGPIICFAGPPGVGKTSLGKSIARAMGRKFVRMSLGGMRDEAEIRGHRRTYIGALPGRIIQGIRNAETNNPVFMFDEVDKIGQDFRGDPASALLEVLDPEQNDSFNDHYIDLPFDLSKVLFITTANLIDPIPAPLYDRMEVIEIPGYTEEDKVAIAGKFVIPKQLKEHGLKTRQLRFTKTALRLIIRHYTMEAGLRSLERAVAGICRKVARKIASGEVKSMKVDDKNLTDFLGPIMFTSEIAGRKDAVGVATGLSWTAYGGSILFIEAALMKGKKLLILTGKLGDVMQESAHAAMSYVRSKADELGVDISILEDHEIHIHVPAGAIPKDGPSAGVTMMTVIASVISGRPIKHDIAMTGEITLRGRVMPVGGIKEKVLAAHRAGIRKLIMPKENEKDLIDVPAEVKKVMTFHFVETAAEVLELTLSKRRRKLNIRPNTALPAGNQARL